MKTKQKIVSFEDILFGLMLLFAFLYTCVRAYQINITNDEAYSFFLIKTSYWKAMLTTANTHWLNSFFIYLLSFIPSQEVIFIRLHSIAGFLLMSFYVYRIGQRFMKQRHGSLVLLAIAFFANHFALEYFAYARGYAMSIAFLTASLYHGLCFIQNSSFQVKDFNRSLFWGILAVFANYTSLFQFIGIMLFQIIVLWSDKKHLQAVFKHLRSFWVVFFIGTIVVSTGNLWAIKLISNDLQYGGDVSFFTNTLDSIYQILLYHEPQNDHATLHFSYTSSITAMGPALALIVGIRKHSKTLMGISSLFFFQMLCNYTLFFLFRTPFPLFRSASILLPSMALSFVFLWNELNGNTSIKKSLAILLLSGASIHLLTSMHPQTSYEWWKQSHVNEALSDLKENAGTKQVNVLMSGKIFSVWTNYYRLTRPEWKNINGIMLPEERKYVHRSDLDGHAYLLTNVPPETTIKSLRKIKTYKHSHKHQMILYEIIY